jgi:hypothetical protein
MDGDVVCSGSVFLFLIVVVQVPRLGNLVPLRAVDRLGATDLATVEFVRPNEVKSVDSWDAWHFVWR